MKGSKLTFTPSPTIPPHAAGAQILTHSEVNPREAWTQRITRWLQLLVLTSPIAFVLGYSFQQAFIRGLGLTPGDFQLDTSEYLVNGLYALVTIAEHLLKREAVWWVIFCTGFAFVSVVFIFGFIDRFLKSRFRDHLNRTKVKIERFVQAVKKGYAPEVSAGIAAFITAMLPPIILVSLIFVVLVPYAAERAGRAKSFELWQKLQRPENLDVYPTYEMVDSGGVAIVHIVGASSTNYIVFDGRRFRAVRKELVKEQVGGTMPWSPP